MIETERLVLRGWQEEDRSGLRALNADPAVMQHFLTTMSAAESDAALQRYSDWDKTQGFTFWPVIRKADYVFLGLCGLKQLNIPWPEPTDIEIGWRFARAFWGQGYAREAAAACLDFGLAKAPRVIAMTTQENTASWGLMRRLGMAPAPELDFEHPDVPVGHPQRPHIVYVKSAAC